MKSQSLSVALHALAVALFLMLCAATHRTQRQIEIQHLVFMPQDVPVPVVRPIVAERSAVATESKSTKRSLASPAAALNLAPRLTARTATSRLALPFLSPSLLPAVESPSLPVVSQGAVSLAAQPEVGGFSNAPGVSHAAGMVQRVAFESSAQPAQVTPRSPEPVTTAPIVTGMPRPRYTAEAAAAHVHGEVTVEVNLRATGQAAVVRVVSGLGYGLDEQALRVVEGLRFTPASLEGRPVDRVTLVHVLFHE